MPRENEDRIDLYERTRSELIQSQRSNAEQFDRSVLTLSAGFLAISVGFVGDFYPPEDTLYPSLLIASWILFGVTIVSTLLGIQMGQILISQLVDSAEKYYVEQDETAFSVSEKLPRVINGINWFVGFLFSSAVVCTIIFAAINFENAMSSKSPDYEKRSQPVNSFSKVKPQTQSPKQGQGNQSSGSSGKDKK